MTTTRAMQWKKWPEKQPKKTGYYICWNGDNWYVGDYLGHGKWEDDIPKYWLAITLPIGETI